MVDEDELKLDWTNVFEELKYGAEKMGKNDTEFGTCLKCLRKSWGNFDEKFMISEGRSHGITVYFVDCDEHAGATI